MTLCCVDKRVAKWSRSGADPEAGTSDEHWYSGDAATSD
jgi:hypothetical protein